MTTTPLSLLLITAIVVLSGVYFWQVTSTSTSVYRLGQLEDRHEEVRIVQERLKLQIVEQESPERLAEAARELGLQQPQRIHYLDAKDLDVAVIAPQP